MLRPHWGWDLAGAQAFSYQVNVSQNTAVGFPISGQVCISEDTNIKAAGLQILQCVGQLVARCPRATVVCSRSTALAASVCLAPPPADAACPAVVETGLTQCFVAIQLDGPSCGTTIANVVQNCIPSLPSNPSNCYSLPQTTRSSADPNELVGPTGTGTQRWVAGNAPLQYLISFANEQKLPPHPPSKSPSQTRSIQTLT